MFSFDPAMYRRPPMIFPEPRYNQLEQKVERPDGTTETYSAVFIERQAYVCVPADHPWATMGDFEAPLPVHGGCTWNQDYVNPNYKVEGGFFLGWDYSHACGMENHARGVSGGRVYDESSKEDVIADARRVIADAILHRDDVVKPGVRHDIGDITEEMYSMFTALANAFGAGTQDSSDESGESGESGENSRN